jgi:hypothetical protein
MQAAFFRQLGTIASVVIRKPGMSWHLQRSADLGGSYALRDHIAVFPVWASKPKAY